MQQPVIAIYDKLTGLFNNPQTCVHPAEVLRDWKIICEDKTTKFGKNPEDFALFKVGTYDYTTGKFENLQKPEEL